MSRFENLSPGEIEKCKQAIATCACLNFRKVARSVTQTFDEALQPVGLRSTQLVVLIGAAMESSSSIAGLARDLVMDASTLQRNLRPLERDGLLEIVAAERGQRKYVRLTAKGRQRLLAAIPLWERAQGQFVDQLGNRNWQELLKRLDQVLEVSNPLAPLTDA